MPVRKEQLLNNGRTLLIGYVVNPDPAILDNENLCIPDGLDDDLLVMGLKPFFISR